MCTYKPHAIVCVWCVCVCVWCVVCVYVCVSVVFGVWCVRVVFGVCVCVHAHKVVSGSSVFTAVLYL